ILSLETQISEETKLISNIDQNITSMKDKVDKIVSNSSIKYIGTGNSAYKSGATTNLHTEVPYQFPSEKNAGKEIIETDRLTTSNISDVSLDNARRGINKLAAQSDLNQELKESNSGKEKLIQNFLIKTELKKLKSENNTD